MTGFTIFHPLWAGFYSRPFYRHAAKNWRFLSVLAMLVGLTACWVPSFVKFAASMPELNAQLEKQIFAQWPTLIIDNGVASTPEKRPYLLAVGEKTKVPFLIVDTSAQTTQLAEGGAPQMLITDRRVFIRKSTSETRVYELTGFKHVEVTADKLRGLVRLIFLAVPPLLLAFSAAKRLAQGLALSLAALATATLFGQKRDYGSLLSLSYVALVPPFVLETVWGLTKQSFFGESLVWAAVLIGFNAWAVVASAPEPEPVPVPAAIP